MAADEDYGIDPPLVNLSTTQATSPDVPSGVNNGTTGADVAAMADIRLPANPDDVAAFGDVGNAPMYPGVGATDDGSTEGIQSVIDERAGLAGKSVSGTVNANVGYINPKPNVLDKFFSYTYRASVYLMSPAQYKALTISKKKNVKGFQLLFQSGGAPANSGSTAGAETPANQEQTNSMDAGRNPAFPLDFYIDSISLETLVPGPGARAAHSTATLKFTVVEPANITLIDRMAEAVQSMIPNDGKRVNYSAPSYLMVLRWYGYDENGKLIPGITGADPTTTPSDPNAIIEKFIPFTISKLDWTVAGKLVQYNFECLAYSLSIAAGTRRGTIPFDIELTGESLGKLLSGESTFSGTAPPTDSPGAATTTDQRAINDDLNFMGDVGNGSIADTNAFGDVGNGPPPKANAAPNKVTLRSGLMEALNQFQRKMVQQQKYEMPDTYRITFVKGPEGSPSIENATIVPPGKKVEKSSTPMAAPSTKDPSSKDPSKTAVNPRAKNYTITAGQQIVQVLDLAIRNSTYILDQALTLEIEDEPVLNPQKLGKTVYWYNITMNATPKLPYDNLRNDFAYDIEFIVTPYALQDLNSKYFPLTAFRGVHKSYPYWFTGKNTAVIEYQESLNNNYNITVVGTNPKNLKAEKERRALESSMREQPFYNFQSGSTESRQGSDGKDYEPSANAAEYLYDPKGMANCKLKIIGDPAWIMQGSVGAGVDAANFSFGPFLADGTINYDASQVMFEIVWQRPEDYDLATGLADPYARTNNTKRQPVQSRVYTTTKITSEFRQGRFDQIVEGRIYNFPKPKNPNNKATSSSVPNAGFGAGVSEFGDERPLPQTDAAAVAAQSRANFAATDPRRVDTVEGAARAAELRGGSTTTTGGSSGAGTQADRTTIGSADEYADYGSASGVGAAGTSILVPAPSRGTNAAKTATSTDTTGALPNTANSNPTPAEPSKPVSSNGVVAAFNKFLPPSVGGRAIIAVPDNPQLLARDD